VHSTVQRWKIVQKCLISFTMSCWRMIENIGWNSCVKREEKLHRVKEERGDRGSTVVKTLCYKSEDRGFDSRWCHWNFSLTKFFRSHYGPGVDSASNRNEYQDRFLGVKSGRCVRLTTLPPSCAVVTQSGNLNFLEPSGPLQACNGTDLPFLPRKKEDLQYKERMEG